MGIRLYFDDVTPWWINFINGVGGDRFGSKDRYLEWIKHRDDTLKKHHARLTNGYDETGTWSMALEFDTEPASILFLLKWS